MRSVGLFSFAWSSHSLTEAPAAFGSACTSTSPKSLKHHPASRNALFGAITAGTRPVIAQTVTQAADGRLRPSQTEISGMGLKRFASQARASAKRATVILCGCALPLLTTACASNHVWQFGTTSFEPLGSTAPNTTSTSEFYDTPASVSDDASTGPSSATEWRTYVYPAAMFAYRGDSR
jgi:hypothetical protein